MKALPSGRLDRFARRCDKQIARFRAEDRELIVRPGNFGPVLTQWGRTTGRKGPENTTYAPVRMIASLPNCCFGLLIGNLFRDRVHSRLPGKSLTEVDLFESFPRER